jgi:hypothetical protein
MTEEKGKTETYMRNIIQALSFNLVNSLLIIETCTSK